MADASDEYRAGPVSESTSAHGDELDANRRRLHVRSNFFWAPTIRPPSAKTTARKGDDRRLSFGLLDPHLAEFICDRYRLDKRHLGFDEGSVDSEAFTRHLGTFTLVPEMPTMCPRRERFEYTCIMIRQIVPVFFTMDIPATLAYYKDKLGFECLGTWQDPPVYAIVARDHQTVHFRCAEPPTPNPNKYRGELLDAYLFVEDADILYAEYAAQGVEIARGPANMPWRTREFVVKDCDGRLLAFGSNP